MTLKRKLTDFKQDFKIALDGPSASGKGLIGSILAKEFSLKYIQSSLIYRGLAFICLKQEIDALDDFSVVHLAKNQDIIKIIKDQNLNTEIIGNYASKISIIPQVRSILTDYLVKVMNRNSRIIMEGRDIGTVIAPDADLKIFITADIKVRADRRYKQLQLEQKNCTLSGILELLKERDERDVKRVVAPLKIADDAILIDTSDLSPDQVIAKIKNRINELS